MMRLMPTAHSIVMVAFLLSAIKNCNIPQNGLDENWQTNQEVLNEVRRQVLQTLSFTHKPRAESGYYIVL